MANSITQDMRYRQSFCIYAQKYGVTKAGIKYEHSKQYIAYWLKRYDGTVKSLEKRSRRPHSHPMQHTEQEIKLIADMRRRSPDVGLIDFWSSLLDRGYTRTIAGLYRQMVQMGYFKQRKKKDKHESGVMEAMTFPGEKVQIDVKVVPKKCISNEYGDKYYQYTMIDEFSRMRYLRGYKEQNAYSTTDFLEHAIRYFHRYGVDIKCVQTDNGRELTNRFDKRATLTIFQIKMQELGMKTKQYDRIPHGITERWSVVIEKTKSYSAISISS